MKPQALHVAMILAVISACSLAPDKTSDCRDGATRACGIDLGICTLGAQTCSGGVWGSCSGTPPSMETCDGVDNNCNGVVDEGCDCRPGATRLCNGGAGVCASGQQMCQGGIWGACVSLQPAGPELCDGIDNDCNGVVDDGFDLDVPCNSIGKCPQSRVCSADGRSSTCVDDPRLFSKELCDGIDNDCDGLVDRVDEGGSLRSVCVCQEQTLVIGSATDASIRNNLNLCAGTQCGGDRPNGLLIDNTCYPVCQNSVPNGDWGWENNASCIVATSARGSAALPCGGLPLGMAINYCLDCTGTTDLPFAMCQSVPRFDLTAFGRGQQWLKVDYTFNAAGPARAPVNFWFHAGGDGQRKHLPLVRIGDLPGQYQALLRVEDACFTASTAFGDNCPGQGEQCAQCGDNEVCGAVADCGAYDLSQAWLQVAAEFCPPGSGLHSGSVTVTQVNAVEPNCSLP